MATGVAIISGILERQALSGASAQYQRNSAAAAHIAYIATQQQQRARRVWQHGWRDGVWHERGSAYGGASVSAKRVGSMTASAAAASTTKSGANGGRRQRQHR